MQLNIYHLPTQFSGVLFFIFQKLLSLMNKPLYFLRNRILSNVLLKLLEQLVILLHFFNLFSLFYLIETIFEKHYTFGACFLRDDKLVPINLFIVIILLFIFRLFRKIKPHALQYFAGQRSNILIQLANKTLVARQIF